MQSKLGFAKVEGNWLCIGMQACALQHTSRSPVITSAASDKLTLKIKQSCKSVKLSLESMVAM
jgi:hypothetical protein